MPDENPNTQALETSVFDISDLATPAVWKIGQEEIASKRAGRRLHARADFEAGDVTDQQLEIVTDNIPPRHALIVNWPDHKSDQMMKALELARKAALHRFTETIGERNNMT